MGNRASWKELRVRTMAFSDLLVGPTSFYENVKQIRHLQSSVLAAKFYDRLSLLYRTEQREIILLHPFLRKRRQNVRTKRSSATEKRFCNTCLSKEKLTTCCFRSSFCSGPFYLMQPVNTLFESRKRMGILSVL